MIACPCCQRPLEPTDSAWSGILLNERRSLQSRIYSEREQLRRLEKSRDRHKDALTQTTRMLVFVLETELREMPDG